MIADHPGCLVRRLAIVTIVAGAVVAHTVFALLLAAGQPLLAALAVWAAICTVPAVLIGLGLASAVVVEAVARFVAARRETWPGGSHLRGRMQ